MTQNKTLKQQHEELSNKIKSTYSYFEIKKSMDMVNKFFKEENPKYEIKISTQGSC